MIAQTVAEKIKQRRAQMLIHSAIYYDLNDNVVSDHQWQTWADELQKLQEENPNDCKIDFFDWEFKDWDGSTGNHLPHRHPWVRARAEYILHLCRGGLQTTEDVIKYTPQPTGTLEDFM